MKLRTPCRSCQNDEGWIETRNGQDCVFCAACSRFQYNAPKTETGREVRTVKTTHEAISTKQRWRIIERASCRCELCGRKGDLHVAHVVSVADGHKIGLTDDLLNSDENLVAACSECNLGMGDTSIPLRIMVPILKARYGLKP